VVVDDVTLRQPTLDEVFLQLTGTRAGQQVNGRAASARQGR
jgi:hypothetical protein